MTAPKLTTLLASWSTIFGIQIYAANRFLNPKPEKVDFDLSVHPVSVGKARKLYEKVESRISHIAHDIRRQCKEDCQKRVRPCSILLQMEAMNGGIDRGYGAKTDKAVSSGSLDDDLKVLEDCDTRRLHAFWELERKCKDDCRVGLKSCGIMHELEKMHEGRTKWWSL